MRKTVGPFTVSMSQPHPCWIEISREGYRGGDGPIRLDHRELADLIYALEQVRREARRRLSDPFKEEV